MDDTAGFYNILPPGQNGSVTLASFLEAGGSVVPPHGDDQLAMYADLLYEYDTLLTDATLTDYFKDARFTPDLIESIEEPRAGVVIARDSFGVPHVYGDTDLDAVWGAGYVTARDRLFLADALRHIGRGRISEFLGASEANLEFDRSIYAVAGYTEEELQAQVDRLLDLGPEGVTSYEYFYAFTEGMNAYIRQARLDPFKLPVEYAALQLLLKDWKVTDIVAVSTLVQSLFASGGGAELENAILLSRLYEVYPAAEAEAIYRDLLVREDPEAPVTTEEEFPYLAPPVAPDPSLSAIPDPGSVTLQNPVKTLQEKLAALGLGVPSGMSNWLAVTAEEAEGGRPIAVMGPQTSYFAPQILMEISLHGDTLHARGATFPGLSFLVLLGRGTDYAWSATSGTSDLVDVRAEKLCEPDGSAPTTASVHYLFEGECVPMYRRTDTWFAKPSLGGIALPEIVSADVERTVHGPVIGRATVDGAPVAFSFQRSTWFAEADSTPSFLLLNTNQVSDPESFFDAMSLSTGSFNWLYVDDEDVAFFHAGLYPERAEGVDPELPSWGTGEAEWQGFLPAEAHPRAQNPAQGFLASWNNKPARGWHAADGRYSFGPVHRVQSLMERLEDAVAEGSLSMSDLVVVMEDAATVDLRGSQVLPSALALLAGREDVAPYTALLSAWVEEGSHRRDRDRSGAYEHEAAIALLDAWYEPMIHAVFDDELGGLYDAVPMPFDDHNRQDHLGSAFQEGWYGYLQKAFRQALGQPVAIPLTALACGDGTAPGCADLLAASLLDAVDALSAVYGPDPAGWRAPKADEAIRHKAVGLLTIPEIDWQNRPTFQQVVQVKP